MQNVDSPEQLLNGEERRNLGISVGTGTLAGAATVLAAWTAASTLGVAGTLSGAAAISTTIAALGPTFRRLINN